MTRQEGGQCSIGLMRARLAWLTGAVGLVAAVAYRKLRGRPASEDRRAAELRRRLDESRTLVQERDEFEAAETPVDAAEEMRGRPAE